MLRHRPPTLTAMLDALFCCPLIHDVAAAMPKRRSGRPSRHPIALHLSWAAMARLFGSGNRLDAEIASGNLWPEIVERYNAGAKNHPLGIPVDRTETLYADTHRHTRDRFCEPDSLQALIEAFTAASVVLANDVGLLLPGNGSRTRPDPTCTIYGDGTVLRPIYSVPGGRNDPDAKDHHRHDGVVTGTKLLHFAVRGPQVHRRIILTVDHVADPGREADIAVAAIRRIYPHAPNGIAAVAYDGAFRGTHHNTLMTDLGLIVINRPHTSRARHPRTHQLGTWSHTTRNGQCHHTLVARTGNVHDATLDDTGRTVLSAPCERTQVRRVSRPNNQYRFTAGFTVKCAGDDFTAWISPHPQPGETSHSRADQLRLISTHEPLFDELYGLRNDSEAINANYKSTHIHDRAPVLGSRRQTLDLLAWSILNNANCWATHNRLNIRAA